MTTWEYITLNVEFHPSGVDYTTGKITIARLNEYGQQGWELVSFYRDEIFDLVAVFKRPLNQ